MKNSVVKVVILSIITFGIYGLIWFVGTKNEMNKRGADIPSGWHLIIPILNIIWMWKWAGGVEKVTNGKQSQAMAFIMVFVLSVIGMAIVQSEFNKVA